MLSAATAPYANLAGACVEIVFVRIRLCDRLKYASEQRTLFSMQKRVSQTPICGDHLQITPFCPGKLIVAKAVVAAHSGGYTRRAPARANYAVSEEVRLSPMN